MTTSSASSDHPPATAARLLSLDVYRGAVMLLLATSGLGIARATAGIDHPVAEALHFHGTHPEWSSQFFVLGFSLWDMIQPAFMFIVGVSMPFSYAKRAERGESYAARLRHAWTRALLLVLLGVFLQSLRSDQTNWLFTNVLSQIGLGYGFLFFFVGRDARLQIAAGSLILAGYWLAMVVFPRGLDDFTAHFQPMTTMPQQFDLWFLNLFPREEPFDGHAYSTLNFVPSLVTMLMGLMFGQLLRRKDLPDGSKLRRIFLAAAICLAIAVLAGATICPIVKKLWTPSWTLFSGAYVMAALAAAYWIIDVKKWNGWVFPFVVVGLNPLTMYLLGMITKGWFRDNLHTHLPDDLFAKPHGPVVDACLIAFLFWLILLWMYRNRIFLRL